MIFWPLFVSILLGAATYLLSKWFYSLWRFLPALTALVLGIGTQSVVVYVNPYAIVFSGIILITSLIGANFFNATLSKLVKEERNDYFLWVITLMLMEPSLGALYEYFSKKFTRNYGMAYYEVCSFFLILLCPIFAAFFVWIYQLSQRRHQKVQAD